MQAEKDSLGVEERVRVLSWSMEEVLEACETAVSEVFVFIESRTGG